MASNLRETYKTLRRRGMPPHPELQNSGGAWGLIQGHIRDEDARDLLFAHAVRWLRTSPGEDYISMPDVTSYVGDEDCFRLVLQLTDHLEPSNG